MADRRRRRRRASQDSEEDDESGSGSESGRSSSPASKGLVREPEPVEAPVVRVVVKPDAESECESEDGVGEAVLSDYESADAEENGSHSEGGDEEEEEEAEHLSEEAATPQETVEAKHPLSPAPPTTGERDGKEEEGEEEEEEEEEEVDEQQEQEEKGGRTEVKVEEKTTLSGERQSGDGQESTEDGEPKADGQPGQKLDDDEDRKNPAYIPRKGLFFEHDVRGHAPEQERPKGRNRKLWKDEGRWEHDRFREEEQAPKSREELVAIYGYDIRNGGVSGERAYRPRRQRYSTSPSRTTGPPGGGRSVRSSWHSGGGGGGGGGNSRPAPTVAHPESSSPSSYSSSQRSSAPPRHSSHAPPQRGFQGNRPNQHQAHPGYSSHPRAAAKATPHSNSQRQQGLSLADGEQDMGGAARHRASGRSQSVVVEEISNQDFEDEEDAEGPVSTSTYQNPRPQQRQQTGSGGESGLAPGSSDPSPASSANPEASPPAERPVERKSYSLARRTRSRPADLGKQPSAEEPVMGRGEGDGPTGLTGLDQDLARLSLAGQTWNQNPPSYLRAELRGIPNPMHLGGAAQQFGSMEEMGVGPSRAKRYSSQRQRPVAEPAPLHLGVMDGHYYEPMSYQGPIYSHGDSPAPIPPQGMLVQPEMHLPHPGHPGLHPHQASGPLSNPTLYTASPVSLSPGQPPPQQLMAPPFYPPPGVMTFGSTNYPYPPLYPNPQAQVYGGVTYYDTMQQQAQPKPSPPRRSSQPVSVKPPPEISFLTE